MASRVNRLPWPTEAPSIRPLPESWDPRLQSREPYWTQPEFRFEEGEIARSWQVGSAATRNQVSRWKKFPISSIATTANVNTWGATLTEEDTKWVLDHEAKSELRPKGTIHGIPVITDKFVVKAVYVNGKLEEALLSEYLPATAVSPPSEIQRENV